MDGWMDGWIALLATLFYLERKEQATKVQDQGGRSNICQSELDGDETTKQNPLRFKGY